MARKKHDYIRDTKNIWFPDQVEPDIEDKETFVKYWKREKNRIRYGFHIADGQVFIPGWLYWHTVYWVIELDTKLANGRTYKGLGTPLFRDLEWEIAEDLERAEIEKKTYVLVGSRGFGKSNTCASAIGRIYNFFNNTESLISGGNNNDIKLLADKINIGLSNIHPVFHKQRLLNNWKYEVKAGWKDADTGQDKGSASRISIRNYKDGNDTMVANGTRPKIHIIDEIGKIPNLIKCVLDTEPCWNTASGERFSIPILAGTGGDMEKGADAAVIFRNPRVYNVLEFDDEWEGTGKLGKFVPVTKALNDYKEPWTLYNYLTKVRKMDLTPHPDLDRITVLVSNEERVKEEFVKPRREKALSSTTSNEIIKEKAYYPLVPSESFLTLTANDFPIEACKKQRDWIEKNFQPVRIELYTDLSGVVTHKFTDQMPVRQFPVKNDTDKTGVIEVVEYPVPNAPYGLYVAGIDPYKQSESMYSDSLGSIYIFKRMTDSLTEPYQYMPVAWYTGRPKSIHTWYETVRNLLKWYNAIGMCENADYGFIQYMIEKNETYHLAPGMSFLKELSPTTQHRSDYGLPPTKAVINHLDNTSVIYCKEDFIRVYGDDEPERLLGVTRILDPMLLQEMIVYNKNEGNYDRVRAFGLAVAYAKQLDAQIPKINISQEFKEPKKNVYTSPFMLGGNAGWAGKGPNSSPFKTRRKLF